MVLNSLIEVNVYVHILKYIQTDSAKGKRKRNRKRFKLKIIIEVF